MPRSVAIPVDRRACTPIETVVHHNEALRFAGSSYQRRPQADCGIPGCRRLSKIEISSYIRRTRSGFDTEVAERLDLIFSGVLDADEAVLDRHFVGNVPQSAVVLVEVRGHTRNGGDVMNFVGHAA